MQHEALRLVRAYHDMSQTALAERLGISNSYLSEIEKGKKSVTLDILAKYAEIFNMPLSALMFFSEHIDPNSRSDRARAQIASKAVKMLQWMAAKSPT